MEPMERLMERLKLSAAEKKCIRIGASASARARLVDPQAIRKVLADKLVNADGLTQALGRIWCPIKGGIASISVRIIFSSPSSKHRGRGGP
jgi:hypothetical protein